MQVLRLSYALRLVALGFFVGGALSTSVTRWGLWAGGAVVLAIELWLVYRRDPRRRR